jgi:hypothetical protein
MSPPGAVREKKERKKEVEASSNKTLGHGRTQEEKEGKAKFQPWSTIRHFQCFPV